VNQKKSPNPQHGNNETFKQYNVIKNNSAKCHQVISKILLNIRSWKRNCKVPKIWLLKALNTVK
jgi:hypothetical protein